ASLLGGLVLRADVRMRGRIVADEDGGEAHGSTPRSDVLRHLRANLERERLPVDPDSRHRLRSLVAEPMRMMSLPREPAPEEPETARAHDELLRDLGLCLRTRNLCPRGEVRDLRRRR